MWGFGFRMMSKASEFSKILGSRFAAPQSITSFSPLRIVWPPTFVSQVAVLLNRITGVTQRSISSMACGRSEESEAQSVERLGVLTRTGDKRP